MDGADVVIPNIPAPNNVNQLKHHLEIQRMSKSKGNVVNPDELVAEYGADTVRAYLMFAFDWEKGGPWDPKGVQGVVRWLNEVWDMVVAGPQAEQGDPETERDIERRLGQCDQRCRQHPGQLLRQHDGGHHRLARPVDCGHDLRPPATGPHQPEAGVPDEHAVGERIGDDLD